MDHFLTYTLKLLTKSTTKSFSIFSFIGFQIVNFAIWRKKRNTKSIRDGVNTCEKQFPTTEIAKKVFICVPYSSSSINDVSIYVVKFFFNLTHHSIYVAFFRPTVT